MEPGEQADALLELAESLGIEVRLASAGELGGRAGAMLRLRGRPIMLLDPHAPAAERVAVLAAALAERSDLGDRFVVPELRELIDRAGLGEGLEA